jgi:hypothetical protein
MFSTRSVPDAWRDYLDWTDDVEHEDTRRDRRRRQCGYICAMNALSFFDMCVLSGVPTWLRNSSAGN